MIFIIDEFDPKMVEKNLVVMIIESPIETFIRKLSSVITSGGQFQIRLGNDSLEFFCGVMKLDKSTVRSGGLLDSGELEIGDIAFCLRRSSSISFRCFTIMIKKRE